ncbi:cytochrome P450 [Dendrothele bispora CBS 962.96]|uniref:Cytochrome P450 n=1 Tax=Dendrothele bispora (strain CBS 962.96) TaxID=1314807 RepID=A0A4S8M681_DENBC|nr:cytochrome P450 [Dendrothele bispora CBS 962.96]
MAFILNFSSSQTTPATTQLLTALISAIVLWPLLRLIRRSQRQRKPSIHDVPGPKPESWLTGNLLQMFDPRKGWEFHGMMLEKFGAVASYHTFFGSKRLYISDPKSLHHILIKDQVTGSPGLHTGTYDESRSFIEFNKLVFGQGLLSTVGEHHRKQRKVLNPMFSVGRMRELVPIFYQVAHQLETTLTAKVQSKGPQEIDMLSWLSRAALEFIGRSGLGYSFDPLTNDMSEHEYTRNLKELVHLSTPLMPVRLYVLPWAVKIGSPGFRRAVCKYFPWKRVRRIQELVDYMWNVSEKIYRSKKDSQATDEEDSEEMGSGKSDILNVLIRENERTSEGEDRLNEEEILGQLSTLIFAAHETTSNAMTRMISLLSLHPEVQNKLREEVTEAYVRSGGDIGYDELEGLPYLDAVCRETLRLFPPVPLLFRTAQKDAILPFSKPIPRANHKDSTNPNPINEIFIPKGTSITISILNCNRDPAIWGEDAFEWKPERWLGASGANSLPKSVLEAKIPGVYSPLMTFNAGGRACIGFKFSQLEMKVVMSILVRSFKFSPAPGKKIVWQMSTVAIPLVKSEGQDGDGDSDGSDTGLPQLPVVVEFVKG